MKRRASILLAALLVAGCGSDDGDKGDDKTETTAGDVAVFESPDVGFTFEYPKELEAETRPQGQIVGQVVVEPGKELNALKIRKTADQELGSERYLDEFQRDFAQTVGKVEKREESIGDLDFGVLEFTDSVEQDGESVDFRSVSYFFTGDGKTWQIECIADSEHEDQVDEACKTALESIAF